MNWISKTCFGIQRFSWYRFTSLDAIMDMTSSIICNHCNILVLFVLMQLVPIKLMLSVFMSFRRISILWMTKYSWVLCRLLKILILYSDVNKFCTFHIIFPDYFFSDHSAKKPVMPSMHNQWISNDWWIYSALIFVVLCILGVILCSGEQRMTEKVVLDWPDPWRSDSTAISYS